MDKTTFEAEPSFTRPLRQIFLMLMVSGLVVVGAWVAWSQLSDVFLANVWLNGFIGCVFVFGVLACFLQVWQLLQCVRWIDEFNKGDTGPALNGPALNGQSQAVAPRLLAPLAALLRSRGAKMQISATSSRSIQDSVATRIDEARDITRYLVNLLIFLGLLGTFYGLATTVPAVVETIRNLAPKEGETGMQVFDKLMGGLEAQLGGMGTAFSSSLLGLAGSLVVGLLELFVSHGQNRFYRELEEWLSTITRLGFSTGDGDSDSGESGMLVGVMDQLSRQMEQLQSFMVQADVSRSIGDERLGELGDAIKRLAKKLDAGPAQSAQLSQLASNQIALLTRIAEGQDALLNAVAKPAEPDPGPDAESRMRLRSIDVQLLRILEEISAGRQESVSDLRADLTALTNAVRQLTRSPVGRG